MAHNDLRRNLQVLTEKFVEGVLRAIQSASLADVAGELNGTPNAASSRGRAGKATNTAVAVRGATLLTGKRHLTRRPGGQISQIRAGILRALEESARPLAASEIARAIGEQTAALSFPMAQLRKQGQVSKEGDRTQAVYSLTSRIDAGLSRGKNRVAKLRGKKK